ncbi:MAG: hypothetical protein IJV96_03340 [Clostridia bacterium]|nr:hypothetical protein [Clostridia bacterium]
MKRLIALLLAIVFCCVTLFACGKSSWTMTEFEERLTILQDKGWLLYREVEESSWEERINRELKKLGEESLESDIYTVLEIVDMYSEDQYVFEFASVSDAKKGCDALTMWMEESSYIVNDIRRMRNIVILGETETLRLVIENKEIEELSTKEGLQDGIYINENGTTYEIRGARYTLKAGIVMLEGHYLVKQGAQNNRIIIKVENAYIEGVLLADYELDYIGGSKAGVSLAVGNGYIVIDKTAYYLR